MASIVHDPENAHIHAGLNNIIARATSPVVSSCIVLYL